MALTAQQQELFDIARAAIPKFLFQKAAAAQELIGAAAVTLSSCEDQLKNWFSMAFIKTATDFWLDQHAEDRGTRRQGNETDEALRLRLRILHDAVNRASLLAAANAILAADSVSGTATMTELRNDRAFFKTLATTLVAPAPADVTNGDLLFLPDDGNNSQFEFRFSGAPAGGNFLIDVSSAATAADVATAIATSITVNASDWIGTVYGPSATQVAITDDLGLRIATRGVTSTNSVLSASLVQGKMGGYWGHGYRTTTEKRLTIVVMLPYSTPDATRDAIKEALRQLKAGGVNVVVEVRAVAAKVKIGLYPPGNHATHGGGTQQFVANVRNDAGGSTAVTWKVNGVTGGNATVGTISVGGLYTPPAAIPDPEDVLITAVSVADATVIATSRVKVI